ncbi:MAG: hypothetical protein K2V38_14810 [Gemmataceae bacterium]|nr:hypothetical protein [Gemmataceae bacterium]
MAGSSPLLSPLRLLALSALGFAGWIAYDAARPPSSPQPTVPEPPAAPAPSPPGAKRLPGFVSVSPFRPPLVVGLPRAEVERILADIPCEPTDPAADRQTYRLTVAPDAIPKGMTVGTYRLTVEYTKQAPQTLAEVSVELLSALKPTPVE